MLFTLLILIYLVVIAKSDLTVPWMPQSSCAIAALVIGLIMSSSSQSQLPDVHSAFLVVGKKG